MRENKIRTRLLVIPLATSSVLEHTPEDFLKVVKELLPPPKINK